MDNSMTTRKTTREIKEEITIKEEEEEEALTSTIAIKVDPSIKKQWCLLQALLR